MSEDQSQEPVLVPDSVSAEYVRPAAQIRAELDLYTDTELASVLGIEPERLQLMRSRGEGPRFTKPGKRVFYRQADVKDWLERLSRAPKKRGE